MSSSVPRLRPAPLPRPLRWLPSLLGGALVSGAAAAGPPAAPDARGALLLLCTDACPLPEVAGQEATWRPLPRRVVGPRVHLRRQLRHGPAQDHAAGLPAPVRRVWSLSWQAPAADGGALVAGLAAALDRPGLWVVDPETGARWSGADWAAAVGQDPSAVVQVVERGGRLQTRGLRQWGHAELVSARTDAQAAAGLAGLARVRLAGTAGAGPAQLPVYGCAGDGPAVLSRAARQAGDPPPPLVAVDWPPGLACVAAGPAAASLAQLQVAARERLDGPLRGAFARGEGELLVKLPFPTRHEEGAAGQPGETVVEWLWVAVESWAGDELRGRLRSDAVEAAALVAGTPVSGDAALAFDYLWRPLGGEWEGDRTAAALPAARWAVAEE